MCWQCDHPNATRREYLEHVCEVIADYGWAVQGVQRDRIRPPQAYTVGLTAHGKPELLVTGMRLERATELLDDVASHVLHAEPPRPGERVQLRGGPLIEIVEVTHPAVRLPTAAEIYGPEVRALQLVHADDRGHWPWQAGFRGTHGGQPVLGSRVSPPRASLGSSKI